MANENWRVGFADGAVTAQAVTRNPGWTPVVGDCHPFAFGAVVALVDDAKNAPLIAAAPDLYAALERMLGPAGYTDDNSITRQAKAALAKARGEPLNQ